jgi:hypothetical protein
MTLQINPEVIEVPFFVRFRTCGSECGQKRLVS